MSINRREFLAAGATVLAAPALASAQEEPVRIGAVLPRQGSFALYGDAAALGARVALDMVGNKVLGRPVELLIYDDPNPPEAQQNMRKLIEVNRVCAVMGGINSASGLAIAATGAQRKVPTIISQATVREITGKDCNPYVFRVNAYTGIYTGLVAKHLLPWGKNWYFLVGAYAYGAEVYRLMKREVEAAGGRDVGNDATPMGTTDFSSIILKIREAKPDVVILGIAGLDLASFLKQYGEFGLRIPLGGVALADEELWALPPNPPKMLTGKLWQFNNPANTPEERAVNDAAVKTVGHPATQGCIAGWLSMRMLLAGIEIAKSLEPRAIVRGLEAARPAGVRGHFRDWDHQMLWQPVVCQVRDEIKNKYDPVVIIGRQLSTPEVEALYGSKQDSACHMQPV